VTNWACLKGGAKLDLSERQGGDKLELSLPPTLKHELVDVSWTAERRLHPEALLQERVDVRQLDFNIMRPRKPDRPAANVYLALPESKLDHFHRNLHKKLIQATLSFAFATELSIFLVGKYSISLIQ
jgi:hypothetical protein